MSPVEDLKQVVDAGAEAWLKLSPTHLEKALERSGPNAARHLQEFCIRVQEWLHDEAGKVSNASQTFGQRRAWVEDVASSFLNQIDATRVKTLAQQLGSVDERIEWLEILLHRGVHDRLLPAVVQTGQLAARAAPNARPEIDQDAKRWTARIRSLIHMAARSVRMKNAAESIGDLLSPLPSWLLEDIFRSAGELRAFSAYDLELALALPLIDVGIIVPPFTAAWTASGRNYRLARLLWNLGEYGHKSRLNMQTRLSIGTLPTTEKIQEFLASVEQLLRVSNDGDVVLTRNWIKSAKEQEAEQINLFTGYLNAVPRYPHHERVLDCLSTDREPMGIGTPVWNLPSVSFNIHSSMVSSSLNERREAKFQFHPPDFDTVKVRAHISSEAAAKLALDQPSQEFAIEYLLQMKNSGNPEIKATIKRLLENGDFVVRLNAARDTMAAVVLVNLGRLFEFDTDIDNNTKAVLSDVLKQLVPFIPTKYLSIGEIYDLAELVGQTKVLETQLINRLKIANDAGEIHNLLQSRLITRITGDAILDKLDMAPFLPAVPLDDSALEKWATSMVHLHGDAPLLTSRIIANCTVAFLEQIASSYKYFGVLANEPTNWLEKRMSFKLSVYQQWFNAAPSLVAGHLKAHVQRDFGLWFYCGVREQLPPKNSEPTLVERWLDFVDTTAPDLVDVYLDGAFRHARPGLDVPGDTTIADALAVVTNWLTQRHREASPRLWGVLEKRLNADCNEPETATAIESGDVRDQEIAAIGSAQLPGPPERLRRIRENATRVLQARHAANPMRLQHFRLKRFVEVLRDEAPDLHAELFRRPSAT